MGVLKILAMVSLFTFMINIPLGAWRSSCRKFSFGWFLAIHSAVPLIYMLRIYFALPPVTAIPLLVLTAVGGQLIGGRLLLVNQVKAKKDRSR